MSKQPRVSRRRHNSPSASDYWHSRRVLVTGGTGFIGTAVCTALRSRGVETPLVPRACDYDLTSAEATARMYADFAPNLVIHLAGEGGGIAAHREFPGRHFYANLSIAVNVIEQGRLRGVEKIVHIGTADSYPADGRVPLLESDLWNGLPAEVHASYGVAKLVPQIMLDAYARQYGLTGACVVLTNVYGPGANFDPATSHVVPAMITRFMAALDEGAEQVVCWGSGSPTRDFLYVDDAAEGIAAAAERLDGPQPVNLGSGGEVSIAELAGRVAAAVGFAGEVCWDSSKPDGVARRCLDTTRASEMLGFCPQVSLAKGLERTVAWWREHGQT